MKDFNVLAPVALVLAATSGAASAGPPVDVTFKNSSSEKVLYHAVGANGTSTQINAQPRPSAEVQAGEVSRYTVQSNISPDANYAVVTYRAGSKACKFTTNYLKGVQNGVRVPKWNKSATAEGGARCEVNITTVNYATHAWAVEFTMK
jgi:hypothetical protein